MGHLSSKGVYPAPLEYVELILCRDVYRCLPSELDKEDSAKIQLHIQMMSIEAKMARMK